MISFKKITTAALALSVATFTKAQEQPVTKESFNIVNLNFPGLEKVKSNVDAGKYGDAAAGLLKYYRTRKTAVSDDETNNVSKIDQEKADNALEHKFQPHKGYGFFDYGKDIDWQYWPVKDNEVRWQLHRVQWWPSMGRVYRAGSNEKYAKEWIAEFRSWVTKNPLGLSMDNDKYAWRPLEVSERLNSIRDAFNLFISSPNFTPAFLMEFLNSYTQQSGYLITHYAAEGNHRLFESQRAIAAGCFLPELKAAPGWRKSGIDVLTTEIKKQIYPDGMQWELSPNYHVAMIDIFLNGLRLAKQAGLEKEFPGNYKATVEKMILAVINFSFPDYIYPMFGDAKLPSKSVALRQYKNWAQDFPDNEVIQYFATDGKKGHIPDYLSHGLTTSGFYTFRNGWDKKATVMVLKASPPGEFHAQPDNGTFNLWVKGRNFTPDAGSYVYSGDSDIMKLRNWYRQTRVHSTLTLNNENMAITKAHQDKWETGNNLDILTYTNPSYKNLDHQRSVLFIDQKYFLIIDNAIGTDTGTLGTHFQLKEDSKPVYDKAGDKVYTTYDDGNNLLIQNLNKDKILLSEEEGKVSYAYRQEEERPAFVFEKQKTDVNTQSFITVLYPFEGSKAPEIKVTEDAGNNYEKGNLDIAISIDGKTKKIQTKLY